MAAEGKIRDQGHGAGHTFPAKPHLTLATWSSLAPSTELGQIGRILPTYRSTFLLAGAAGSALHWGGIPGAATLTRWRPCAQSWGWEAGDPASCRCSGHVPVPREPGTKCSPAARRVLGPH